MQNRLVRAICCEALLVQDAVDRVNGVEFAPIAPGEILAEEFLAGYGLTQAVLAKALGISPNRIAQIVNNRRRIAADTAVRSGLFFGTTPEFWQNRQAHWDLKMARRALPTDGAERIVAQSVVRETIMGET